MAERNDSGVITLPADGAIAKHLRVKMSSGQVTTCGDGATDETVEIGCVADETFAAGDNVGIVLRNKQGTHKMVAAAAVAADALVYGAAGGMVDDVVSGAALGVALDAASGAGAIIEVIRFG